MSFTIQKDENHRKIALIDGSHSSIYIDEKDSDSNKFYDVELSKPNQTFIPYLEKIENQNYRVVIASPSGSGKSILCNKILNSLSYCVDKSLEIIKAKEPDEDDEKIHTNKIFLFTNLIDDDLAYQKSYNGRDVKKILITYEILTLSLEDFKDCICVFDDYTSKDRTLNIFVQSLIDLLLTQARKRNVHIVTIIHDIKMGTETKMINTESNIICLFPGFSNHNQISSYLKLYVGFDKKQIEDVIDTSSRWVIINKFFPRVVLTEKRIYFPQRFQQKRRC